MRAPIGDIVTAGAADLAAALLDECAAIASQQKFPPREAALQQSRAMLTAAGSGLTPSMLRDIERGARTEADHVLGDLLRRCGEPEGSHSLLRIAFAHLNVYEARRALTNAASDGASRT
jgi:2-dehydropantoate 2-reductase